MVMGRSGLEDDYREGRSVDYLHSSWTAEKYMNTDTVNVEDRAAGTRRLHLTLFIM